MLINMALDPQLIENNNIVVNKIENDTLFAENMCPQLGVNGSYLSQKCAFMGS